MAASLRALFSVVMLIGFYFVAFLLLLFTTALSLALMGVTPVLLFITAPLFVAIFSGAGVALWRAARLRHEHPPGVVLTPDQAPLLWAQVRRLAEAAGTRPPHEVRLVAAANAAVSQHSRLFGLWGGRRYLYLGLPLIQALTAGQMRAVVAHELGHFSGAHTRFGPVAYRGRLAVGGTISRISRRNVAGWVFRGYARVYLLVDNVAARRQERQADAVAVKVAGKQAAISALTEVHVAGAAFAAYLGAHVSSGAHLGLMPDDIFGGFTWMLAENAEVLDEVRGEVVEPEEPSRWDTHPPLHDRIAAINALSGDTMSPDPTPATAWLPGLNNLGRLLQREAIPAEGRTVLPWQDFSSLVMNARLQEQSDSIFREIGRVLGRRHIDLPTILDQVEANAVGPIAAPFFPDSTKRESATKFHHTLRVLLMLAAVHSGAARWLHSWSGPSVLVDANGEKLPLAEVAKLAADPQTLAQGKARLAEMGIDFYSARVVEDVASARGARLLGALSNILIDGSDTDVFILDTGLVLAPATGGKMDGDKRVARMTNLTPPETLALRFKHLPYEDIKSMRLENGRLIKGVLRLRDGSEMKVQEGWGSGQLGSNSRQAFYDVVRAINSR